LLFTVVEVTDDEVTVDGNHPLAGKTLTFNCTVIDVRKATEEELEHGHVHEEGSEHLH
jgi:FKBP-type peptidyl-prolyl cis-trans isomerase SlyD